MRQLRLASTLNCLHGEAEIQAHKVAWVEFPKGIALDIGPVSFYFQDKAAALLALQTAIDTINDVATETD